MKIETTNQICFYYIFMYLYAYIAADTVCLCLCARERVYVCLVCVRACVRKEFSPFFRYGR